MTSICLVTSRKKWLQILVRWQCQGLIGEVVLALFLAIVCGGNLIVCVGRMPVLTLRGSLVEWPYSFPQTVPR